MLAFKRANNFQLNNSVEFLIKLKGMCHSNDGAEPFPFQTVTRNCCLSSSRQAGDGEGRRDARFQMIVLTPIRCGCLVLRFHSKIHFIVVVGVVD